MQIANRILIPFVMVVLLGAGVYGYVKQKSYESRILDLQNEIAQRDTTIEIKDGLYKKNVIQIQSISGLLDSKNKEVESLKKELKKTHAELLSASSLSLTWKKAYEASVAANQSEVPGDKPGDPSRKKVEFSKDFGYIGVDGYTLTDPGFAFVKVKQNRPLKLTLSLAQMPDGRWQTYVTSSEENMEVAVDFSAINPLVLEKRWYERLGMQVAAGIGKNVAAGSFSLLYDVERFEIGPSIWVVTADQTYTFFGASFVWRPFARIK